jgi:titin
MTLPQPVPGNSQLAQYYHDVPGTRLIETSTGNTIRSLLVNNKVFLVFQASMLGVSIVDVYRALGFPAIYEVYSYYGTRNLALPDQVSQVHTVIGNGSVSLNWEPSFTDGKPRLGYIIEYVDQEPIARLYVPWVVYSDKYPLTNVTITGLTNGTMYYFRVAAINVVGIGKYSNIVTCIPGTRPDAVSTLFINTNTNTPNTNTVVAEWTEPYNQGYLISRYTIRYRKSVLNPPINPPDTTWSETTNINVVTFQSNDPLVSRIVRGTTTTLSYPILISSPLETDIYEFQISGSNVLGTSDFKNTAPVTNTTLPDPQSMTLIPPNVVFSRLGASALPGKVSISSVIPTIIPDSGGKKIKLSWLVPAYTAYVPYAYALEYVVVPDISGVPVPQPGTIPDASWNIIPPTMFTVSEDTLRSAVEDGSGTAVMTIISNLTNGRKYSFKIAALNAVGRGAYSDALPNTVIPGSVPAVLNSSTQMAFTINTETGGEITLYWLTPNKNGYNITNYRVRRRISSQQITEWTVIEIAVPSGITNTSEYRKLTTLNLVNGTSYDFQVASKNLLGWSEYSDTLVAVPRKVPDPISNITASPLNQGLRVMWNTQGVNDGGYPIIGYQVQYNPVTNSTPSDQWSKVDVDGIYSSNVELSGLVNGITHRIRVLQINAIGPSRPELSTIIQAVPGVVSLAPTGLFISIGNARITLFWTTPSNTGTNDASYYYVQYKRSSDPDTAYEYVKNSGQTIPRQYGSADVSLVPNAPGYDAFVARIDGLVNGTDYSVRVAAITQVGQGAWSSPIQGKPGTVPSKIL